MNPIVLYENFTGTTPSPTKTISGRRALYRVTVRSTVAGTVQLRLRDPWGEPIPIPNAESNADDAYEVVLNAGDVVDAAITAGSPENLYVALKAIASG